MGRRFNMRGLLAGAGTLAVVVGLAFAGVRGGYPATRPQLLSGSAWLASAQVGQLTLLDGSSAEVAAQVQVANRGEQLDVVQQAATAYAVNRWRTTSATPGTCPPSSAATCAARVACCARCGRCSTPARWCTPGATGAACVAR